MNYRFNPSAMEQSPHHFRELREITVKQIEQTLGDHAAAARRSFQGGYDGVKITAFIDYLIANLLSPHANKITDKFGCTVENRTTFTVEKLQAIRKEIGSSKPVIVRLNAVELRDEFGGSTPEE